MKSCIIGKHLCKKVLFCYGKKEVARYEPQATEKFFGAAVFQKCCRGVGE